MLNKSLSQLSDFYKSESSYIKGGEIARKIKKYPKTFGFLACLMGGYIGTNYGQEQVNAQRDELNHAFSISEMSVEHRVLAILGTSVHSNRINQQLGIREIPETGLVHLYGTEMSSIENAREYIQEMRNSGIPYIFSADVEGGWVSHLTVTREELLDFGFPEEFLNLRRQEVEAYINDPARIEEVLLTHPTPSQEWLGRTYSELQTDEERIEFLRLMEAYGLAMSRICEYIGINLMFGPILDRVENIDGETPMERDDRSYGSNYEIIRDLAIAYLSGVRQVQSVTAVPKHFIGNGVSINDPHYHSTESNIDRHRGTAILPFRDIINFSNGIDPNGARYQRFLENLRGANEGHFERLEQAETDTERAQIQVHIDANNERILANLALLRDTELGFLRSIFEEGIDVPVIMASNVSTNLYNDIGVPTMFSENALNALSRAKNQNGLGFEGITITDDISMESSHDYISSHVGFFSDYDIEALAAYTAIGRGNEIAFLRGIAGNEEYIAGEIARYIQEGVDIDNDGNPELTMTQLDRAVERVLELKVELGILERAEIRGETFYVLNPNIYNPSTATVVRDSFFSNQWPWLVRDEYYEALGREDDQSNVRLMYKALKNFGITLYSTLTNDPFNGIGTDRYSESESNPRELIVIDKSARYLWRYNLETRELIDSFEIGIGRGGEGPRRVIGDHRTPAGTYQIIGRRDAQWWEENKGVEMPEYYGGEDGGMLVMAGQWTPEIAIHGGGGLGLVSNACIRVEDPMIQRLMREVADGSMVIITN